MLDWAAWTSAKGRLKKERSACRRMGRLIAKTLSYQRDGGESFGPTRPECFLLSNRNQLPLHRPFLQLPEQQSPLPLHASLFPAQLTH